MSSPSSEPVYNRRAYLDIETDAAKIITVIGVHRPDKGTRQWLRGSLSRDELREFISGVDVLFTYNGGRFDLPIILEQLFIDLAAEFNHRDLMHDCWARNLYGGLKKVEIKLGIQRDTEGVDGLEAIRLWESYRQRGNKDALDLLLRYNREDIENLELLARRLGVIRGESAEGKPAVFGSMERSGL